MNQTLYSNDYTTQTFPTLQHSLSCDIAIIGGGLSGLHVAYLLSDTNKDICLFEANTICHSNSGRNTGKITQQQKLLYADLIKNIGFEATKQFVDTSQHAFDTIRDIIQQNNIACDYQSSDSVVYTTLEEDVKKIEAEYDACKQLGMDVALELRNPIDSNSKLSLVLKKQAGYNPKKYCAALSLLLANKGIRLYEQTPMVSYQKNEDNIMITTKDGQQVTASQVIVATSFPCFDDGNLYFLRLPNIRSYIVSGKSKSISALDRYFINSNKPSKSIRHYQGQLMICGGSHPVGVERPDPFRELKEIGIKDYQMSDFEFAWAAQDYLTQDLLPYAGYLSPNSKRMFVLTGYNQWGNINSMICALVVSDLVQGIEHPLLAVVSPQRVLPLLGVQFASDNLKMIGEMIRSKFQTKGKVPKHPQEYALVRLNDHTYGAYMNEFNELFLVDVLCTHAGCTLRFNDAEKTWDCPCHSSRFDYRGNILSGPATQPLHVFNDGYNQIDPHWFD